MPGRKAAAPYWQAGPSTYRVHELSDGRRFKVVAARRRGGPDVAVTTWGVSGDATVVVLRGLGRCRFVPSPIHFTLDSRIFCNDNAIKP